MNNHDSLALKSWTSKVVKDADFSVTPIKLSESKEWVHLGGKLTHRSGLFFNVVGAQWQNNKEIIYQPLIEQREIGTLGFMIHGNEILVQAKIEPGNVNACQIAPTYQATASNAARAHGGKTPQLKRWFLPTANNILYQTLNSEQGTRFLGKLNRNTIVNVKRKLLPGLHYQWISTNSLLDALDADHLVNTDARSVLVCAPWDKIVSHEPFHRYDTKFSKKLIASFNEIRPNQVEKVINRLQEMRTKSKEAVEIPINSIPYWTMNDKGLKHVNRGHFRVRQIRVKTKSREVPVWDQPIIDSVSGGAVDVYCGTNNSKVYFLLKPVSEIGLLHRVELGPSFIREPGKSIADRPRRGRTLAYVCQSDEGGRFFQDVTRYRIVDIGSLDNIKKEEFWLSLGEIHELLRRDGLLTNEARSCLSLLLKWL